MRMNYLMALAFFTFPIVLFSQVDNDPCIYAHHIPDVDNYCSDGAVFTNVDAESDPEIANPCLMNYDNAVWFSFTPSEPAVVIQVIGSSGAGTLTSPEVAVFSGSCGNLFVEGCNITSTNLGVVELTVGELVIGQTYYLMVDGVNEAVGTFQLCINDFVPIPFPEDDCGDGVILCDKSPFQVESLTGTGSQNNEVDPESCIGEEFASSWYKWTCDESGSLTFSISANNENPSIETDDIDFALYRLTNGLDDCSNKELIRCMASGANVGSDYSAWSICNGPTGLSESSTDVSEAPGCNDGSDNFVAAVNMVSGESYVLLVNNFSQSGLGFSIDFGGTGTFLGPDVDFSIQASDEFECDKTIQFIDSTLTATDSIVSWSWNFGAGSTPLFSNQPGPHEIIYESFGDKVAALTLESEKGCRVTKILDFYIEPCCEDFPDLDVQGLPRHLRCFGDTDGQILANGSGGSPQYQYSLDTVDSDIPTVFQPNPRFSQLVAGSYDLYIQDIKGCKDSITIEVTQPEELIAFAGADIEVDLGYTSFLNGAYTPSYKIIDSLQWIGPDWLDCPTCFSTKIFPLGTTQYTIQITDIDGCTAEDSMLVKVNLIRPFYAPNAFSPNGDGYNDVFSLFGGPAIESIDNFSVFDRWGNLVYQGTELAINNPAVGWDGTYKEKLMNPGTYVWMANVRFIDGAVLNFAGDVTLVN